MRNRDTFYCTTTSGDVLKGSAIPLGLRRRGRRPEWMVSRPPRAVCAAPIPGASARSRAAAWRTGGPLQPARPAAAACRPLACTAPRAASLPAPPVAPPGRQQAAGPSRRAGGCGLAAGSSAAHAAGGWRGDSAGRRPWRVRGAACAWEDVMSVHVYGGSHGLPAAMRGRHHWVGEGGRSCVGGECVNSDVPISMLAL